MSREQNRNPRPDLLNPKISATLKKVFSQYEKALSAKRVLVVENRCNDPAPNEDCGVLAKHFITAFQKTDDDKGPLITFVEQLKQRVLSQMRDEHSAGQWHEESYKEALKFFYLVLMHHVAVSGNQEQENESLRTILQVLREEEFIGELYFLNGAEYPAQLESMNTAATKVVGVIKTCAAVSDHCKAYQEEVSETTDKNEAKYAAQAAELESMASGLRLKALRRSFKQFEHEAKNPNAKLKGFLKTVGHILTVGLVSKVKYGTARFWRRYDQQFPATLKMAKDIAGDEPRRVTKLTTLHRNAVRT